MKPFVAAEFDQWCAALGIVRKGRKATFAAGSASFSISLQRCGPSRLVALAETLIPNWEDVPFEGAAIQIGRRPPWGDYAEQLSDRLFELAHKGVSTEADLPVTVARYFGRDEHIDFHAHFLVPLLLSWDAIVVPSTGKSFIDISHDGAIWVICESTDVCDVLKSRLNSWEPRDAPIEKT